MAAAFSFSASAARSAIWRAAASSLVGCRSTVSFLRPNDWWPAAGVSEMRMPTHSSCEATALRPSPLLRAARYFLHSSPVGSMPSYTTTPPWDTPAPRSAPLPPIQLSRSPLRDFSTTTSLEHPTATSVRLCTENSVPKDTSTYAVPNVACASQPSREARRGSRLAPGWPSSSSLTLATEKSENEHERGR